MNLVDANVLLYAVNASDPRHQVARGWLDAALNAGEPVGFSWVALLAFLRLSTKVGLFPAPLSVQEACGRIEAWLAQPSAILVDPTTRHFAVLAGLIGETGSGGNLVNDAHLAALAVEHAATIISYDWDFGRFKGVRASAPSL